MTDRKPSPVVRRIEFEQVEAFTAVTGHHAENLRALERRWGVKLGSRGTGLTLEGDPPAVRLLENALGQLYDLAVQGFPLYQDDVLRGVDMVASNERIKLANVFLDTVLVAASSRTVAPKSRRQKLYIEAIRNFDLVFGVGPAGTGKTYLAMAMAVHAYVDKQVKRIVLTRPAVEAGEKLGFLPGDLAEKVNPYLRPLYDALHDMMGMEKAAKLASRGHIEVAPLAFMRGRTLNDAFVILDEAQNTTREQMKMFLTRLGFGSKAVVTGDITQVDLPIDRESGLSHALKVLEGIDGIGTVRFQREDVVRHPLVQRIVQAYEEREAAEQMERERRRQAAVAKVVERLDADDPSADDPSAVEPPLGETNNV